MRSTLLKFTLPALPLSGGCQCGAFRYRITGAPVVFYFCHCTQCQRQSTSAFAESLRIRTSDFEPEGELAEFHWTVEGGRPRQGRYCPRCGVRIFHDSGQLINIKGGTLDDTSWLRPAGHIWTRSRQPWLQFGDEELVYPQGPEDDFAALIARWRQMTGF